METLYNLLTNQWLLMIAGILIVVVVFVWRRKRKITQQIETHSYLNNSHDTVEKPEDLFTLVDGSAAVAKKTVEPTVNKEFEPELIIILYVVAQQKSGFSGNDLLAVLEEVGLRYGEMKIFHHYGVGDLKVKRPVFSVANMLEPGTFNLSKIEELVTSGLAIFMRLPGPFGGRVAFELMLNKAQRLAEVLKGTLKDAQHNPLDQRIIETLREQITQFERR